MLSVPGQMLANTPVYTLTREMLMQADHHVLEIGCAARRPGVSQRRMAYPVFSQTEM